MRVVRHSPFFVCPRDAACFAASHGAPVLSSSKLGEGGGCTCGKSARYNSMLAVARITFLSSDGIDIDIILHWLPHNHLQFFDITGIIPPRQVFLGGLMQLRDYQSDLIARAHAQWDSGAKNVMISLATGGGKTVIFSALTQQLDMPTIAIAHRKELVDQMSLTYARHAIQHDIIHAGANVRSIVAAHIAATGQSYYRPGASIYVAGIDTLWARREQLRDVFNRTKLWIMDEGHHILRDNKWGRVLSLFANAKGLAVTATPLRADGLGLGAHTAGMMHALVQGPQTRELIDAGYLCEYRLVCPHSDIDLSACKVSATTGDYSQSQLSNAMIGSKIVGDTISNYLRFAGGMRAVVFATDVATARKMASKFNVSGVRAQAISAKSHALVRNSAVHDLRCGKLDVLINVDLLGEGFDLPAIDCVILARPTQSLGLYLQQCGRSLRPSPGKQHALIIDQVDNVIGRHGLPDINRLWSLDSRDKTERKSTPTLLRICSNSECVRPYPRASGVCPFCGTRPAVGDRSSIEAVDGDLHELSPDVLADMRAAVSEIDMPLDEYRDRLRDRNCPEIGVAANCKRHRADQSSQRELRDAMARWAGYYLDDTNYRRFYAQFNIDALSAQALRAADADALRLEIEIDLRRLAL